MMVRSVGLGAYLDIISVSQTSKLLLPGSVPHIEPDGAPVGVENQWMDLRKSVNYGNITINF